MANPVHVLSVLRCHRLTGEKTWPSIISDATPSNKSTQGEIYVKDVPGPFTTKRISEEHQLTRFKKSLFHSFLPTTAWTSPRKKQEELQQEEKKAEKEDEIERRRTVMVFREKTSQLIIGKILSHCMSASHTIIIMFCFK